MANEDWRINQEIARNNNIVVNLTDQQFGAYFRERENFEAGMHVADIIRAVGRYDDYDDGDWGRFAYQWYRNDFRVRVITNSDYIVEIESLDPTLRSRSGETIEVLWERPAIVERSPVDELPSARASSRMTDRRTRINAEFAWNWSTHGVVIIAASAIAVSIWKFPRISVVLAGLYLWKAWK
jgi:hypothetical protein